MLIRDFLCVLCSFAVAKLTNPWRNSGGAIPRRRVGAVVGVTSIGGVTPAGMAMMMMMMMVGGRIRGVGGVFMPMMMAMMMR